MEINNEIEDATNIDNVAEINTETTETPQVQIADTSQETFFYDQDTAEEHSQEQEINSQEPNIDSPSEETSNGYEGNNQYINALYDWAKENEIDLEELGYEKFDEEKFNKDHMMQVVGRTQAMNYLTNTDPDLHKIVSKGMSVKDYVQERMNYEQMMNTDDATLFKGQMYNYLLNKNVEMGVATANEDGSLSQQSHEAIIQEIERHTSNMTAEQFKQKGAEIRENLQQQINNIPDYLQQKYEAQQKQNMEQYEAQRAEYMSNLKDTINNTKNIVVGFADQSARDDFSSFIDEQTKLSEVEVNGQKQMVVPLFHKLQNDSEFLLQTLRLQHMHENGYFTDTTNKARTNAYKELGIMPSSKGKSGRKSNAKTHKGVNIANTSTKDFFNS